MKNVAHPRFRTSLLVGLLLVPLVTACGSSSTEGEPVPPSGKAGQAGAAGKAGAAGSGQGGAGAAGAAGKGGEGGAAAGAGGATAGKGGASGMSGSSGQGGASAGQGGQGGASGQAGGGQAGGGQAGAGQGGSTSGCEGDPLLGAECGSGLKGVCAKGHNQCIQGVISCVPDVGPGEQDEVCDGQDNDCDGETDEGLVKQTYFVDNDGDGFGSTATIEACALGPGLSENSTDCNDNSKDIYPGATEQCNDVDDNCNGAIDDGAQKTTYFVDADGDGFGSTATIQACALGPGLSDKGTDCNDSNKDIYPGAIELCNDVDDNCNGAVDEGVQKPTFYKDNDGDGFGGPTSKLACTAPMGYVEEAGDCNDFNKTIFPGAPEQCNNADDDCNGQVDDNVQLLTIYKDNDGDGFADKSALSQQKCDIPVGFTVAKDINGDGQPDWDCNDSSVKVYPGAPEVCGDGLDNSCSGVVDRLCFTACEGTWPFKLQYTYDTLDDITAVDLDGDGLHEITVQENYGFAILDRTGKPLYNYSAPSHNYSRAQITLGDIDSYDKFNDEIQSIEVLSGNGSRPRFYKLNNDKSITLYENSDLPPGSPVYDASPFMATDFDHDGQTEFVSSTWCEKVGTKILRFDRASGVIKLVNTIDDPEAQCEYTDGRTLTDLDGDGVPELVFSNGYPQPTVPSQWGGHIFAQRFTNLTSLSSAPYCPYGMCFNTDVPGLFSGAIAGPMFRIGDELRAFGFYFTSNTPNNNNPYSFNFWHFDLAGQATANTTQNNFYVNNTDIDHDGTPENSSEVAFLGLYDVNGDSFPDRLRAAGPNLEVDLWDPVKKGFVNHAPSSFKGATTEMTVKAVRDINNDGRIDVLSTDTVGNLYCHSLGQDTWNRYNNLPPHFTPYLRTYQWDNFEPNEGKDTNGDGLPDQTIRLASAMTAKGDFYSYLSSPTDRDYFIVDSAYVTEICVHAPAGHAYDLKVFAFADRINNDTKAVPPDGKPDGLIAQKTGPEQVKCFSGYELTPNRHGEHKFAVGIESSTGDFTPFLPYWLSVKK